MTNSHLAENPLPASVKLPSSAEVYHVGTPVVDPGTRVGLSSVGGVSAEGGGSPVVRPISIEPAIPSGLENGEPSKAHF